MEDSDYFDSVRSYPVEYSIGKPLNLCTPHPRPLFGIPFGLVTHSDQRLPNLANQLHTQTMGLPFMPSGRVVQVRLSLGRQSQP